MKNTKKEYPLPGPGDHFLDQQLIKKVKEEHRDKFVHHFKDQLAIKPSFSKSTRELALTKMSRQSSKAAAKLREEPLAGVCCIS